MLIWVGSQAPLEFVRDVFGANSPQAVDARVCELPEIDSRVGAAVRRLVDDTRHKRRNAMRVSGYVHLEGDIYETSNRNF